MSLNIYFLGYSLVDWEICCFSLCCFLEYSAKYDNVKGFILDSRNYLYLCLEL